MKYNDEPLTQHDVETIHLDVRLGIYGIGEAFLPHEGVNAARTGQEGNHHSPVS
jgi:hypothetical protein